MITPRDILEKDIQDATERFLVTVYRDIKSDVDALVEKGKEVKFEKK